MSDQPPEAVSKKEQPSFRAQIIFWVSVLAWIGLCFLTALMLPLLQALQPSLQGGLWLSILVPVALLLAANVAAVYPAFIAKALRRNAVITIAWILSVIAAALGDAAFLWGVARLLVFGPSFP